MSREAILTTITRDRQKPAGIEKNLKIVPVLRFFFCVTNFDEFEKSVAISKKLNKTLEIGHFQIYCQFLPMYRSTSIFPGRREKWPEFQEKRGISHRIANNYKKVENLQTYTKKTSFVLS